MRVWGGDGEERAPGGPAGLPSRGRIPWPEVAYVLTVIVLAALLIAGAG